MANIEEARYQILMSEEGKNLVQARYAIRNNQRNFLKLSLPQGAIVWSATISGIPIRPGQASDGSLLLPLEKARAGEEAPAFAAEVLYFCRGEKWNGNGKLKITLPALDLPVSRTGLRYFYPPLFRVTPEPGPFRIQTYQSPTSTVLSTGYEQAKPGQGAGMGGGIGSGVGVGPGSKEKDTQTLINNYRNQSQEGKRAGILPVKLSFPEFGPSIFLVSELTAENQSPSIDVSYAAEKKGGAR